MSEIKSFDDFGFSAIISEAIRAKGYETPSPIQAQAIPVLLSKGGNLVGKAQTGTGKTAAFALPILEKVEVGNKSVRAIILTPTRELAMQVAEEMVSLKGAKRLRIQTVYGGQGMNQQLNALARGVDIVIGTPGRIKDHINRGTLKINDLQFFVLDEADEMLNMGFLEEIEEILQSTNDDKQMLLFSATMPKKILSLIKSYMTSYELIEVESTQQTNNMVRQVYYQVKGSERFDALCRIIDASKDFYGIVFCNTKREVDEVVLKLIERGVDAEGLHGDIQQTQREAIMKKMKKHKVSVLVATDVAARGIDVNDLTHVVNFQLPQDPESYIHRIGRTGRAGKEGIAVTLVSRGEQSDLMYIQKITNTKINLEKLPAIEDVLTVKKQIIKDKIKNIIEHSGYSDYIEISQEILEENDPEIALASILKYAFKDQLQLDKYVEFLHHPEMERRERPGSNGRDAGRVFIAKGKSDGFNAKTIVDFLVNEGNLKASQIDEVKVLDEFSFATLPVEEAQILVDFYKKAAKGKKPLVTMAVSKDDDRARGNNRFGGGGGARRTGGFDKPRSGGFDKPRSGGFDKPRSGGYDKPRSGGFDKPTGEREGGRRERKKF